MTVALSYLDSKNDHVKYISLWTVCFFGLCLLLLAFYFLQKESNPQQISARLQGCLFQTDVMDNAIARSNKLKECQIVSNIDRNQSQKHFYVSTVMRLKWLVIAGAVGIILALITRYFSLRKVRHEEQAQEVNSELNRQSHYDSRYVKAVEMLGCWRDVTEYEHEERKIQVPNIEVRLGAIYALEDLALSSKLHQEKILDVLCAYVRSSQGRVDEDELLPQDVGAALYSILKIHTFVPNIVLDLTEVTFCNLLFEEYADFSKVRLSRSKFVNCCIVGAKFYGEHMNIFHSMTMIDCTLRSTTFSGEFKSCDWSENNFLNSKFVDCRMLGIDFSGSRLCNSVISDSSFYACDFSGTDFSNAKIKNLVFDNNCKFLDAVFMGNSAFEPDLSILALDGRDRDFVELKPIRFSSLDSPSLLAPIQYWNSHNPDKLVCDLNDGSPS